MQGKDTEGVSSTTNELLRELIELQKKQAADEEKAARLERMRQRREKPHAMATSVAGALGVISALIASALLAALLVPPDVVYKTNLWGGEEGVDAACYTSGDLTRCKMWQRMYGISASLAFVLQVAVLLMTVAVAMGRTGWLHRALFSFLAGVWCVTLAVIAIFWLSCPKGLAIFATVCMAVLIFVSLLLLPSVVVWAVWPLFNVFGRNKKDYKHVTVLNWAAYAYGKITENRVTRFFIGALLRLVAMTEDDEIDRQDSFPALIVAAAQGNKNSVRILLNVGAAPDVVHVLSSEDFMKTGSGRLVSSKRGAAAETGRERIFQNVWEAWKSEQGNALFPLLVAARSNHHEVVLQLLKFDADPNMQDSRGNTALHAASEEGNLKVVKTLVKHGAQPDICNGQGLKPVELARRKQYGEVVQFLEPCTSECTDSQRPPTPQNTSSAAFNSPQGASPQVLALDESSAASFASESSYTVLGTVC